MNEVVKIIPDQKDFRNFFYSVISDDYQLSDELHSVISAFCGKPKTGIRRKDLEKISIVKLMLLLNDYVRVDESFSLFGIRDKKTGKLWHFLYANCQANLDGLAVMDLTGWNTSGLYNLDAAMDSDDFCLIAQAHDLWLGHNKAFIFRGSGMNDVFFYLASYLRKDKSDMEICIAGTQTHHIEKEGPYAGGYTKKFWFRDGFVDNAYHQLTPRIFTGGSDFSEGLAAVCLAGRWAYVNEDFIFILPPEYGYAEPFSGGIARVLILNDYGKKRKGVWKAYRTEGLNLFKLPEPIAETGPHLTPEAGSRIPETTLLPEVNFCDQDYNGISSHHDFSISMSNILAFTEHHLNDFQHLGNWAIIDRMGRVVWEQTEEHQYPSRTEKGCFAVYSSGKTVFLDAEGKLLKEKPYEPEEDPANLSDWEEDSYQPSRKAAFKVSSEWKEVVEINGRKLSFSFAFHLFHLVNSPKKQADTGEFQLIVRKNQLTRSADFRLFSEIRQFTGMNGYSARESTFVYQPEKILQFLANGMEAPFITRISKELLRDAGFLKKAVKRNALILEHLEPEMVRILLKKQTVFRNYLLEVSKHAVGERIGPSNSRRGKIPLLDTGKVILEDYIQSAGDALACLEIFPSLYDYLGDELANDSGCIHFIMQIQGDFYGLEAGFLYAQALIRKNFYVDNKRITNVIRKQLAIFPELFELFPDCYRKDKKFVLEVLKSSNYENCQKSPFRFVWPSLLKNADFVLEALSADQEAFAVLPATYRSDLTFIRRMFELGVFDIFRSTEYVSENLLDDEGFWNCISDRYIMARYASKRIREIHGIQPEEALGADLPF